MCLFYKFFRNNLNTLLELALHLRETLEVLPVEGC